MAITPMMQQYLQMKEENREAILFFRLGDFYEMFFDDAELVSRELELTLTGRDCGLTQRAPMCGVPYHAVDTYISRLIDKGYKVAICDQMTDPAESNGLVERAITRIITPGTVIEANLLDDRAPSYILSLCFQKDKAGVAFCDVSTGEFSVYLVIPASGRLFDELRRIAPKELLVSDIERLNALGLGDAAPVSQMEASAFDYKTAMSVLTAHFPLSAQETLTLAGDKLCVCAAGALMRYLTDTQKNALCHILEMRRFEPSRYMTVDPIAARNLELTQTGRGRGKKGSLLYVMDQTVTAMGARMLRSWIERPLYRRDEIEKRLDAVSLFKDDLFRAEALGERLSGVYDVERLLSKIAYERVNARDCLSLLSSLQAVPEIRASLSDVNDPLTGEIRELLDDVPELSALLEKAISPDAPLSVKDGGIIKSGYDERLDTLRSASTDGKSWIAGLEAREREETGIKNLKIGFNRVFGYYIEVTKSYYELVPYRYTRKQTLANCERFITEELKEIEKKVLGADDQAIRLEYELFAGIREKLREALPRLQKTAQGLKTLDALLALAKIAAQNDFVRPRLNDEGILEIKDGRHPMVEQALGKDRFVPNDCHLSKENRVMIITGPNMAGKSTYMRQVALIVLMAHIGSFVPALEANLPLVDRIFTRIGASDDLYGGQSTFMVEMNELATILKYATDRSLILLDEVGRGTSTFDGLSIAWAAVEHIAQKTKAITLFATHYHELSELEGQLEGVVNYRITAKEQGDDVIFLRKIVPGGADRSFGVAVASLAGLPSSLIARARQIMARLEVNGELSGTIGKSILDKRKNAGNKQVGFQDYPAMELAEEIAALDVIGMTPIDALNKLYLLKEKARRI